jgi:hypothetical protein
MRAKIGIFALGAVTMAAVLVAVVAFAPAALAQTPTPNTPGNSQGYGPGILGGGMMGGQGGMHGRMMGGGGAGMMGQENSLIAVAAGELNMTTEELIAALDGTKSIAQIAAERNVPLSQIVDAFIAPRSEHLDELVANGRLTQEQADEMLATMTTHVNERLNEVWTPNGPGQGAGFADEDGDGVCDHMGEGGGMMGGFQGRGRAGR